MKACYLLLLIPALLAFPQELADDCFCNLIDQKGYVTCSSNSISHNCPANCKKPPCQKYIIEKERNDSNLFKISCINQGKFYKIDLKYSLCPTNKPSACFNIVKSTNELMKDKEQQYKLSLTECFKGDFDLVLDCNATYTPLFKKLSCDVSQEIQEELNLDSSNYQFESYNKIFLFWDDVIKNYFMKSIRNLKAKWEHALKIRYLSRLSESIYDITALPLIYQKTFENKEFNTLGTVGYSTEIHKVVVAFRGTEKGSFKNWMTNLNKKIVPTTMCNDCQVHQGFDKAMNGLENLLDYTDSLSKIFPRVIFTGHSLGGALATLALGKIKNTANAQLSLITFGSPKVGNNHFVDFINKKASGENIRVKFNEDIASDFPNLPEYVHVGNLMCFKDINNYSNLENEPSCGLFTKILHHTQYKNLEPNYKPNLRRKRRHNLAVFPPIIK